MIIIWGCTCWNQFLELEIQKLNTGIFMKVDSKFSAQLTVIMSEDIIYYSI